MGPESPTTRPTPATSPAPDQTSVDFVHNVAVVTCAAAMLAVVGGLVAGYFLGLTSTEILVSILLTVLALMAPSPLQR